MSLPGMTVLATFHRSCPFAHPQVSLTARRRVDLMLSCYKDKPDSRQAGVEWNVVSGSLDQEPGADRLGGAIRSLKVQVRPASCGRHIDCSRTGIGPRQTVANCQGYILSAVSVGRVEFPCRPGADRADPAIAQPSPGSCWHRA